jgi:FkbM family methyltransferase
MTLISYAQNFEDVLLWRCLKNITEGFYIDVGASHPDNESVTRMFYDAGWRGINIEPNPEDFNRLKAARTRDINLAVAVGEVAGRERLFVVPGTGLSTLSEPIASRHVTAGAGLHEALVDVQTLAEVCREHAPSTIHFLKIDVEGSEASVVASADFVAFNYGPRDAPGVGAHAGGGGIPVCLVRWSQSLLYRTGMLGPIFPILHHSAKRVRRLSAGLRYELGEADPSG